MKQCVDPKLRSEYPAKAVAKVKAHLMDHCILVLYSSEIYSRLDVPKKTMTSYDVHIIVKFCFDMIC